MEYTDKTIPIAEICATLRIFRPTLYRCGALLNQRCKRSGDKSGCEKIPRSLDRSHKNALDELSPSEVMIAHHGSTNAGVPLGRSLWTN